MRRILFGLGTIVMVASAAYVGSTGAFFSDTETSTGNTFAAGDIDLRIDNTSYVTNMEGVLVASPANTWEISDLTNQLFFSFADVKPGDIGEDTISIHPGTNDAFACMAADITSIPDNGINEPEADAGDVTDNNAGELQNFLNFTFWNDDGDNVYEVGETLLTDLQGNAATIFDGNWQTIADAGSPAPLEGGSTSYVGKAWCFGTLTSTNVPQDGVNTSGPLDGRGTGFTCDGSGDNNVAQTDGITVDVSFYAVQARNNGQFSCSDLPAFEGVAPSESPIGAALGAYDAPACDITVSSTTPELDTIAEGIEAADSGETVCVAPGTYSEDVVVNKSIVLAGAGAATTFIIGQTSGEAGAVVITADNATVQGFDITEATGGVAAVRVSGSHAGILIDSNEINGSIGGAALLFDGGQSSHTVRNNVIVGGDAGQPIAYVNGLASVNTASNNVAFINNTFSGSGSLALGQEASNSSVLYNKFSAVTSFADVEDWEDGNTYNQNNFHDAGLNLQHSENGNTGDNGITNAEDNWWGDNNPADGDASVDVDFVPFAVSPFAEN